MKITDKFGAISHGLSLSLIFLVFLHVLGLYSLPTLRDIQSNHLGKYQSYDSYKSFVSAKQNSIVDETKEIIQKNYVEPIDMSGSYIEKAYVEGLVSSLKDPFSEYLNGKELEYFSESLRGNFAGIGAVITSVDDGVVIREVLQDSPAYKAQLKVGDIITMVNTGSLRGVTTTEAVNLIRGKPGTAVDITYRRGGLINKINIIRSIVKVPSIESEKTKDGFLYIRVKMFGQDTARDFSEILLKNNPKEIKALVIDLRDNGGGLLSAAQEMLSHFFKEDTVVLRDRGRKNNGGKYLSGGLFEEEVKTSNTNPIMTNLPIVVLVNENSASASEIFAGAIQDLKRGKVIGRKTYGKGSVQQPFELSDGSQIKITIARWFTPLNHSIDKLGITPDITLEPIPIDASMEKILSLLGQEKSKALELAKKLTQ
ncbi:MAG: S41 family peptidase [Candidatus Gracilibacteria bacterium]